MARSTDERESRDARTTSSEEVDARRSAGRPIASRPSAWYLVCPSSSLRRGAHVSTEVGGTPLVLFRGASGEVGALSAYCPHLGAHLGAGRVVGSLLRCQLHHRAYARDGICGSAPGHERPERLARIGAYPILERYGCVFVFAGATPSFQTPGFAGFADEELVTSLGAPVALRCPWEAVVANAFDMQHLALVHDRALRSPPELARPDAHRCELRYASRVTGTTAADRAVQWISGDLIEVEIVCWGGTVVTVESRVGGYASALMVSVAPTREGCVVTPMFGVLRGRSRALDRIRVSLARWLFTSFVTRDIRVLDGIRFNPGPTLPQDAILAEFLDYLATLPEADAGRRQPSV